MNKPSPLHLVRVVLIAAAVICFGCNGGGSDDAIPIGPDIRGDWAGRFYVRGGTSSNEQVITATISQNGDAIILKTSLVGIGASLTGTIQADGDMLLTDAFDGELWTTHYQPAKTNFVQVADFLSRPEVGETNSPPLNVIELRR